MSSARPKWLAVSAAVLLPVVFAIVTQHAWEDYFITLRSSRHLVGGHGLVFNAGERVHTFTSPLGVLLPALCTALAGPGREELALWLFRAINVALLGGAAAWVWQRGTTLGWGPVGRLTALGLVFADAKLVDFSINGMETALLVGFVLMLWSELEAPHPPRVGVLALAIGGLMWTRPDAFVLGGALLIARVTFRAARPGNGGSSDAISAIPWARLTRGVVLGGLLYLPWFAWAWWYYGTPVPHTVTAKAAYTPSLDLGTLLLIPWQTLTGRSLLVDLFLPTYWSFGGWPAMLPHLAHALAAIAAFAWLFPFAAHVRRVSFAVFLGMFYVCSIVLFPWYVPPWTALAGLALAGLADGIFAAATTAGRGGWAMATRTACAAAVGVQLAALAATAWQMRIEQSVVENGVRRALGEWLRQNAGPRDTVFLEPLGYIGYFSQLKTYDFPGLSSPEVVAAVRGGARRYADVIARLRPTWVVLRPHEAARPEFAQTGVLRAYEFVRAWDGLPALNAIAFLPGRPWVEGEARFLLFRRKPE